MKRHFFASLCCVLLVSSLASGPTAANTVQEDGHSYKPTVGQVGKDVVWVPTSQELIDIMLDMAELKPDDKLVDLGSGDGRTVISAAKRGIATRGIEYNPDLVALARSIALQEGVADRVILEEGDIFESDFSDATVVTMFLLPKLNMRLRPILLEMPAGTRVISNSFLMEDWQPDETRKTSEDCSGHCIAYKWVVPAKVAGTWKMQDESGERKLVLNQKFQEVEGEIHENGRSTALTDGSINGTRLSFRIDDRHYEAQIDGSRLQGTIDGKHNWKAEQVRS